MTPLDPGVDEAVDFKTDQVYDVVVYGSTGAGFGAALQAARAGLSTILIEPGPRLGGMTTGGLGATDIGNSRTIGGIGREFYARIYAHYLDPQNWTNESREEYFPKHPDNIEEAAGLQFFFEPSVALRIMTEMLEEHKVPILKMAPLDREARLERDGRRILSIPLKAGKRIAGRMFLDASYEGDLMAMAEVPFCLGREANDQFGETLNGFRPHPASETEHISPFLIPDDPASGLLPGIDPLPDAQPGDGDQRIQAYNFRLCLTDIPANRIPISRPERYDPLLFEPLARHLLAKGIACPFFPFFKRTPLPNRKTDSNNFGLFSTDFVGMSHGWPTGSDADREQIWQAHRNYTEGLLWFLGNDPRFPESWRQAVRRWGYARDEFTETGNWPAQLYVREARRLRADYVVTEADCRGLRVAGDPVALGSYAMDSHQVSRFVDAQGRLRIEGGFWKTCAPYPISYRAIVPEKGSCPNLVVPVCVSSTHAAYGSIRMEPVFMMLGQAGAIAAGIALREGTSLQEIDYCTLECDLMSAGAVLGSPANASL